MTKKKLYIVAHTHWDREWYMSFGKHRYHFVKFMDRLINILEGDPRFTCFHLDGQVILINDYLSVRPQQETRLKNLIQTGRIKIGPFYILQDEYLISGEANVRNVLYGIKECEKYGVYEKVGYFPDAFGNISQMPQILRGFNLDCAAFGRGIVPMGYANEVLGKGDGGFSEINWVSPDGSSVVAVQFINWYHNAYEIPSQQDKAIERLNWIKESMSYVSKTDSLLGMNGCDHEPVQADLAEILDSVKGELDFDVKISSLGEYIESIKPFKESFYNHVGEINGQNGSGYFTLINTASARIYLKQMNHAVQHRLENILEPLSVFGNAVGLKYDSDIINFTWKKLMENHPHDSICGCGVDEVAREMVVRFTDSGDTCNCLISDVGARFVSKIQTDSYKNAVVFNLDIKPKRKIVTVDVDYEGDCPQSVCVKSGGKKVFSSVVKDWVHKKFELPEDKFRQVTEVRTLRIEFLAEVEALSYKTYAIEADGENNSGALNAENRELNVCNAGLIFDGSGAENEHVIIRFNKDGSFDFIDKKTGVTFKNQNYYEDSADFGDEYTYLGNGEKLTTLNSTAHIALKQSSKTSVAFEVKNTLLIPSEFSRDNKTRGGKLEEMTIITQVMLKVDSKTVEINTRFENVCDNHRLRAVFASGVNADKCVADGQFDLLERNIDMGAKWLNPDNCQRMCSFVSVGGDSGEIIATRGLNEYEIINGTEIAITLMRAVDQLGDWFYFPTPGAQCKGLNDVSYAVTAAGGSFAEGAERAYEYSRPKLECFVVGKQLGILPMSQQYAKISSSQNVQVSAIKRSENGKFDILRVYNPFKEGGHIVLASENIKSVYITNMNEEIISKVTAEARGSFVDSAETSGSFVDSAEARNYFIDVGAKKIVTLAIER